MFGHPWHPRVRDHAYPLFAVGLLMVLLLAFAVAEALDVTLLTDPATTLHGAGPLVGVVSVGLLFADVVLPMPASIVMTLNGALFGVTVGAALSLIGGMGATLLGVTIGRRSRNLVNRLASPGQQRRAEGLLSRYGPVAVVVTGPVPLLAETTVIMAGTAVCPWRRAAFAGMVGNIAQAVVYALAGSVALRTAQTALVFVGVIMAAAIFWACTRRKTSAGDLQGSA